jgi:hypothetical protein
MEFSRRMESHSLELGKMKIMPLVIPMLDFTFDQLKTTACFP